jgi:putative ABC transport system permease protein
MRARIGAAIAALGTAALWTTAPFRAAAVIALLSFAPCTAAPLSAQTIDSAPTHPTAVRSIALDARMASDASLRLGDTVRVSAAPNDTAAERVVVSALLARRADPSEIARSEYRARVHLDQLQRLVGYGDRVDRFAIRSTGDSARTSLLATINNAAFGFRAWPSADIAVRTSRTFQVVRRFHRAIGVITIVASAAFLLCILLLKIDERRRDVAALRMIGISAATIVRSVVLEAGIIALLGSIAGVVIGIVMATLVNWHFQAVHRTTLAFTLVTLDTVLFACGLSVVLGVVAGWVAARRLVGVPALALLGR